MTLNGQRMSKSLGTIVDPIEAAERLGADPLRLYLVKEIAFGGDGDFSWERYEERYNVDLANNLGNLVSRVAAMAEQYRGGRLRADRRRARSARRASASRRSADYRAAMDRFALHEGAAAAFRLIDARQRIHRRDRAVGAGEGSGAARTGSTQVLFDAAEAIRLAAVLLPPIMPASARRSCAASACDSDRLASRSRRPLAHRRRAGARHRTDRSGRARGDGSGRRQHGPRLAATMRRPESSGQRPDNRSHAGQRQRRSTRSRHQHRRPPAPAQRAAAPRTGAAAAPQRLRIDRITIDDFMKVDLRVAKVLAAERVPKSKKLLKLPSTSAPSSARSSPASPKPTSPRRSSAGPSSSCST